MSNIPLLTWFCFLYKAKHQACSGNVTDSAVLLNHKKAMKMVSNVTIGAESCKYHVNCDFYSLLVLSRSRGQRYQQAYYSHWTKSNKNTDEIVFPMIIDSTVCRKSTNNVLLANTNAIGNATLLVWWLTKSGL